MCVYQTRENNLLMFQTPINSEITNLLFMGLGNCLLSQQIQLTHWINSLIRLCVDPPHCYLVTASLSPKPHSDPWPRRVCSSSTDAETQPSGVFQSAAFSFLTNEKLSGRLRPLVLKMWQSIGTLLHVKISLKDKPVISQNKGQHCLAPPSYAKNYHFCFSFSSPPFFNTEEKNGSFIRAQAPCLC